VSTQGLRILGVIPARGGSKGVPGKNIRALGDKPLIAHTIECALATNRVTRTIVSTDDQAIADVARQWGADVPFMRPPELATDTALAIPTLQHALQATEALDQSTYDALVMLQPTTPFRTERDLDAALALLEKSGADSVISVVDVEGHHPARMKYMDGDRLIDPPFCEAI